MRAPAAAAQPGDEAGGGALDAAQAVARQQEGDVAPRRVGGERQQRPGADGAGGTGGRGAARGARIAPPGARRRGGEGGGQPGGPGLGDDGAAAMPRGVGQGDGATVLVVNGRSAF